MTSVAERIDIADRLRGISLTGSQRVDVEADAPERAHVTTGWVRKWDGNKLEYFWENTETHDVTRVNPFAFGSPSDVPREMRNQWFTVFDELKQRNLYVNPSLAKEQWTAPVENTSTTQPMKAFYLEEYAETHYNRRRGWLTREEPIDSLLAYSKDALSHPLLKMDKSYNRTALLLNKEIQTITRGKRDNEGDDECIRRIIALLLLSPEVLIDECYCQLMKQMTKCHTQYRYSLLVNVD